MTPSASTGARAQGVEWLHRHLGSGYRIHEIESRCPNPMHIDTTILPLGPGKILINPEYIDPDRLPDILKKWDILVAPEPDPIDEAVLRITSLYERADGGREACYRRSASYGDDACDGEMRIRADSLPFLHYAAFGGAFHCATLDIRRRGELESYF